MVAIPGLICLMILVFPAMLFANKISHKRVTVYSDRPIESTIYSVIDDAIRRIATSELYSPDQTFTIFICNSRWRFWLFSFGNPDIGGIAYDRFTRDIYIRESDIRNNRIIPPYDPNYKGPFFSFTDRPLSFYFAHEMTHIMQSRYLGRFQSQPLWLHEGYADYIGKGGDFDLKENLKLLHDKAPELDPVKGLYRRHHLKVAYLLDIQRQSIKEVYKNIPADTVLEAQVRSLKYVSQ